MKKYMAISESTAEQFGEEVEAENVTDACSKLGFHDFDVQDDDMAMAWVGNEAYHVSGD